MKPGPVAFLESAYSGHAGIRSGIDGRVESGQFLVRNGDTNRAQEPGEATGKDKGARGQRYPRASPKQHIRDPAGGEAKDQTKTDDKAHALNLRQPVGGHSDLEGRCTFP